MEGLVYECERPACVFGGWNKKLDYGTKVVHFFSPEMIDYMEWRKDQRRDKKYRIPDELIYNE